VLRRSIELTRSGDIIDAVESYLAQNVNLSSTQLLPAYRSRVRQMIPADAQAHYWANGYDLDDGAETYVLDCPKGVPDDVSAAERQAECRDSAMGCLRACSTPGGRIEAGLPEAVTANAVRQGTPSRGT